MQLKNATFDNDKEIVTIVHASGTKTSVSNYKYNTIKSIRPIDAIVTTETAETALEIVHVNRSIHFRMLYIPISLHYYSETNTVMLLEWCS